MRTANGLISTPSPFSSRIEARVKAHCRERRAWIIRRRLLKISWSIVQVRSNCLQSRRSHNFRAVKKEVQVQTPKKYSRLKTLMNNPFLLP